MENTERDTAITAAPQNDWQNAQSNTAPNDNSDEHLHPMAGLDAPDPDEEEEDDVDEDDVDEDDEEEDDDAEEDDEEEEKEEETGDWGHVDPAESNSPFPDSNDPTSPGSAV